MTQNVDDKRVVMRKRIADDLDLYRAAPDGFQARPDSHAPELENATTPFFSIVIPNYNGVRFLPALLHSLKMQTFRDFECILVDDASTDNSVEIADLDLLEVRIVINSHNLGFVKACNIGASASSGRFIVLLNSDTEPEPDWLAELAKGTCANPQASIFASKVLLMEPPGHLHTTGDILGRDGVPGNRGVWEADNGQYDSATDVFSGSGCAVAYDRRLWDTLGGFDESFWMYLEDVDFSFRARLLGAQAVYIPKARVHHHLTATASGMLSSFYVGRNTIWMIAKNMPASLLTENYASIIRAQLDITVDALRNFRGAEARARLKGQLVGLLTLPLILQKRRVIQERRLASDEQIDEALTS